MDQSWLYRRLFPTSVWHKNSKDKWWIDFWFSGVTDGEWVGGGCAYKRATRRILAVLVPINILIVVVDTQTPIYTHIKVSANKTGNLKKIGGFYLCQMSIPGWDIIL